MKTISYKGIFIWGAAALVLSALATSPSAARGGHMQGGFDGDLFRSEHMASELELTDAQRVEFERIMNDGRGTARPHVQQMIEVRKAMRQLMDAESFDEAAVRLLAAKKNASMTELMVIRVRKRFEFKSLLTAEQKEKLQHLHERRDIHP